MTGITVRAQIIAGIEEAVKHGAHKYTAYSSIDLQIHTLEYLQRDKLGDRRSTIAKNPVNELSDKFYRFVQMNIEI